MGILGEQAASRGLTIGRQNIASLRRAFAAVRTDSLLFWMALALFAFTRLVGIERFPIYFFTDEAVQTVQAAGLVDHGFKDSHGRLLPTYFQNGTYWNLSFSVYAQIIPYKLFGFSIFATRATSALIGLSGTAAVGLILRDIFKARAWWFGPLFLSITPAWFLHSRTAFETAEATALYAWFLYFYLRYRYVSARNLFPALMFGALAFYAYSAIQIVIAATAVAFGLSDLRYHIRNWRICALGLAFVCVLALPYLRFNLQQGGETSLHLRTLGSYWVQPGISFDDRMTRFWHEYQLGLSPSYWFGTSSHEIVRHVMKGYGFILVYTAPFFFLGLATCVVRIRSSLHRNVLIATALTPLGAAIVAMAVTRAMAFLVPAAILTALGAALVIETLARKLPYVSLAILSFALLAAVNLFMLRDALTSGPTWYTDYGLYGMQFGARQVAAAIERQLDETPEAAVYLSPNWTNGGDVVMRFLLPNEKRLRFGNAAEFSLEKKGIPSNAVFVLPSEEWTATLDDPKFANIVIVRTVPYPTGAPGFYFVTLTYSAAADSIFAAEAEERRKAVTELVTMAGEQLEVTHSKLDLGGIRDLFDGDSFTVARTLEANPMVIEIAFSQPRQLHSLKVVTATLQLGLDVTVLPSDGGDARRYALTVPGAPKEHNVTLVLRPEPPLAKGLRIEIRDLASPPDKAHVHVRDISFD